MLARDRFTAHYTLGHGTWLNQAEIEISLFSLQCFGQEKDPSFPQLQRIAKALNQRTNRDHVTVNWQFPRFNAHRTRSHKKGGIIIRSQPSKRATVSGTITQDNHLALEHIFHSMWDSARTKAGLPLAGEGHPVCAEGSVIIDHDRRSGEMFRRI